MYDKEKVYDEKIYPLMAQIIEICNENDMQMVFSCYLKNNEDGELKCNTYLESKEENCESLKNASLVIQKGYAVQRPFTMVATITSNMTD